jgi:hypothetical protein
MGERLLNEIVSSVHVVVEHVTAGVKHCRIVKDIPCFSIEGISDWVMEIALGLHNLCVSCRHPLPGFSLLSWVDSG